MNSYKVLSKQVFKNRSYKLVPIRLEDSLKIMNWRNEQLYHLRQEKLLTIENQQHYFKHVVAKLFDQEKPNQILFSFLENGKCIGYGGLTHINWIDKNAEVSFIMKTSLEKERFDEIWSEFLILLENVAFNVLSFHKIFTFAFDLRPHLYLVLEKGGFYKESILREHCFFANKYLDVIIHSKINKNE